MVGVWVDPVTAQVMITLRDFLGMVAYPFLVRGLMGIRFTGQAV